MGKSGRRYVFWFWMKHLLGQVKQLQAWAALTWASFSWYFEITYGIMEFIFMQAKWWCHCCGTIVPSTQNRVVSPLTVQMKYSHRSIKITTALLVSRTNAMYWHSTNIAGNVRHFATAVDSHVNLFANWSFKSIQSVLFYPNLYTKNAITKYISIFFPRRYRKSIRAIEQGIEEVPSIVPALKQSTGREVPLNTNSELILFCRRVYEFRLRRLIKNPS